MEHQFAYPTVRPLPPRGLETVRETRVTEMAGSAYSVTLRCFGQTGGPTAADGRSAVPPSQTPRR